MIRYWAFERTVRLSPVFTLTSSYHHTVAFEENSPPWKFNHMIKCSSSTENMHLICFRLLLREKLSSCAQSKTNIQRRPRWNVYSTGKSMKHCASDKTTRVGGNYLSFLFLFPYFTNGWEIIYHDRYRPNEGYLIAHTCKMNVQFFFMKEKRTNTHRMMNNIPVYFSIWNIHTGLDMPYFLNKS